MVTTRARRPLAEMDAHSAAHVAANSPDLTAHFRADGVADRDLRLANRAEVPLVTTEAEISPLIHNPLGLDNPWAALRTPLSGLDPPRECVHRLRIPINWNPNQ